MLTEALHTLRDWVTAGEQPKAVQISDDKALVAWPGGETTEVEFEPPPESHRVNTLQSFLDLIEKQRTDDSVIFLNQQRALLVDSLATRRHHLGLELQVAPQFATISQFCREEPLGQRDLLELLRHELRGYAPQELQSLARRIEAKSSSRQESDLNVGRERGVMEFQTEIVSEIAVPEDVRFHVPVFRGERLDSHFKIDCSLGVNLPPGPVSFKIEPFPGEVHEALLQGLLAIQAAISEAHSDLLVLIGDTELWQPGRTGFYPAINSPMSSR